MVDTVNGDWRIKSLMISSISIAAMIRFSDISLCKVIINIPFLDQFRSRAYLILCWLAYVKMALKQIGLLTAGAQPWNPRMCTASGDRFAYCSTLAIYIYEVQYHFLYYIILFVISESTTFSLLN